MASKRTQPAAEEKVEFDPIEIGRRIAQARKEAGGLTQEQLGDALGLSKRAVQEYEAGKTIPWKHLTSIAEITRQTTAWLLRGESQIVEATVAQELVHRLDRLEADLALGFRETAAALEAVSQALAVLGSNGPVKSVA